jgi:CheY-like chemotaxis protein
MKGDERVDVIDLIINVLMEHEKKLDDLISRLELIYKTFMDKQGLRLSSSLETEPSQEKGFIPILDKGIHDVLDGKLNDDEEEVDYFDIPKPLLGSILIVDDDKFLVEAFQYILEDVGFSVETVPTANRAIQLVKEKSFELAIVDLRLPDMLGSILAKQLKQLQHGINVVILSASEKGVDGEKILSKPVTHEKLLDVVVSSMKKLE